MSTEERSGRAKEKGQPILYVIDRVTAAGLLGSKRPLMPEPAMAPHVEPARTPRTGSESRLHSCSSRDAKREQREYHEIPARALVPMHRRRGVRSRQGHVNVQAGKSTAIVCASIHTRPSRNIHCVALVKTTA